MANLVRASSSRLIQKYRNDEGAHQRFVAIAEAYDALSHSETRQIYDRYGHDGLAQHRQGGGQRHHDPFDLFSSFFGGGGHYGGQRQGPHMELPVALPLKDFYVGSEREFAVEKQEICDACEGSGSADGHVDHCPQCGGAGIVIQKHMLAPGIFQQIQMACDKCGGKGKIVRLPCKQCGGSRVMRKTSTYMLTVEKGAPKGSKILFENEADASPDWVAGDMIVQLEEEDAKMGESQELRVDGAFFRRNGKDLFWKEVLSLREAWMGDWTRNLTHLDGHVVQISRKRGESVQPNAVEIIEGEGMPLPSEEQHGSEEQFGALHVEYAVVLPDQMENGMEKEFWALWEKWRKKNGVNLERDNGRPPGPIRDEL